MLSPEDGCQPTQAGYLKGAQESEEGEEHDTIDKAEQGPTNLIFT